MLRKEVQTQRVPVACDICGRTLLSGEQAEDYLASGSRRKVCELCAGRALHQGWIREAAQVEVAGSGRVRDERRPLLGRLRSRLDREIAASREDGERPDDSSEVADGDDAYELDSGAETRPDVMIPDALAPAWEPGAEPRHIRAVPASGELKAAQALERFNASAHPKTLGSVGRSLGAPVVAVRATPDQLSVVSVVVSWELCWYRYEVDLAAEGEAVRQVGQGYELDELAEADRDGNASATTDGTLTLGATAL